MSFEPPDGGRLSFAKALDAFIQVKAVQEEYIKPDPETFDRSWQLHRAALGSRIEVTPAEDGHERGCPDHHVKEPDRQLGSFEVRRHFIRVRVEECREGLQGEEIHENYE